MAPEITAQESLKSPVSFTAPKNNSKTVSVMQSLHYGAQK